MSGLVAIVGCEVDERRAPLDSITAAIFLSIDFDAYIGRWRRKKAAATWHGGVMGWCLSGS